MKNMIFEFFKNGVICFLQMKLFILLKYSLYAFFLFYKFINKKKKKHSLVIPFLNMYYGNIMLGTELRELRNYISYELRIESDHTCSEETTNKRKKTLLKVWFLLNSVEVESIRFVQ